MTSFSWGAQCNNPTLFDARPWRTRLGLARTLAHPCRSSSTSSTSKPPSTGGATAAPPSRVTRWTRLQALAEVYGRMVFERLSSVDAGALPSAALDAWLAWYATTPTPPASPSAPPPRATCCAKAAVAASTRCSTGPALDAFEKRAVWRRITLEASAWRFNRYAERG